MSKKKEVELKSMTIKHKFDNYQRVHHVLDKKTEGIVLKWKYDSITREIEYTVQYGKYPNDVVLCYESELSAYNGNNLLGFGKH